LGDYEFQREIREEHNVFKERVCNIVPTVQTSNTVLAKKKNERLRVCRKVSAEKEREMSALQT